MEIDICYSNNFGRLKCTVYGKRLERTATRSDGKKIGLSGHTGDATSPNNFMAAMYNDAGTKVD